MRGLVLIVDNTEESALVDAVFGDQVDGDGLIGVRAAEARLSDGYGEHYIYISADKHIHPADDQEVDPEFVSAFFEDRAIWDHVLPIHASYFHWFCLLGSIQLALRHPDNIGPSSDIIRRMAKEIAERLIEDIPVINREFIEQAKWKEFGIDG